MKTEKDEPINPFFTWNEAGYGETVTFYNPDGSKQFFPYKQGLTKREYFANSVMQALISAYESRGKQPDYFLYDINDMIPQVAVIYADRLIEALNKDLDGKED
jgi:hypothetical protein